MITQALNRVPHSLRGTEALAAAYQQVNSSVGRFATDTLLASSRALASGSASDDHAYVAVDRTLRALAVERDHLAGQMKRVLGPAASGHGPSAHGVAALVHRAADLLGRAHRLAAG